LPVFVLFVRFRSSFRPPPAIRPATAGRNPSACIPAAVAV